MVKLFRPTSTTNIIWLTTNVISLDNLLIVVFLHVLTVCFNWWFRDLESSKTLLILKLFQHFDGHNISRYSDHGMSSGERNNINNNHRERIISPIQSHYNNHNNNSNNSSNGNSVTPSPSPHSNNGAGSSSGGNNNNINGLKSDSPSRKRRRMSMRLPSQSPPNNVWEQRRSPRIQQQIQNQQGSPPIRRARLRDLYHAHHYNNNNNNNNNVNNNQHTFIQPQTHNQPPQQNHHYQPPPPTNRQIWEQQHQVQALIHHQSPPPTHQPPPSVAATAASQPPTQLLVDLNQVPVSIPLRHEPIWTYSSGPHTSICAYPAHPPPPPAHRLAPCQVSRSVFLSNSILKTI